MAHPATGEARLSARAVLLWALVLCAIAVPIAAAALSPLHAYRQPVYIVGSFAGVIGLALLLVQPLLAAGILPGLAPLRARRLHRRAGAALVSAVLLHVAALWISSPPDTIDALLLRAPTPFSAFGVIAMWAALATAILALLRRRLPLRLWHRAHFALVALIVASTVIHALLITGTMETMTKTLLCLAVLAATALALIRRRKRF